MPACNLAVARCTRPVVRYHGGKWRIAPWIIQHLPPHRCYVEPYGGGGSVLLRKDRSYAEVYNDLDGEMVNLFRVARDAGADLRQQLLLTPFARDEFGIAWESSGDPMEQARRTVVRSFMGFGSAAITRARQPCHPKRGGRPMTGFRSNSNRSGTTPARDWMNYPDALDAVIERLRGVVIENRNALDLMPQHDSEHTVYYVDPPYVAATRNKGRDYRHEMSDADHVRLAELLHTLRGAVVVSGYDSALYRTLFADWRRVERTTLADGARARVEVLWLSPRCAEPGLFVFQNDQADREEPAHG